MCACRTQHVVRQLSVSGGFLESCPRASTWRNNDRNHPCRKCCCFFIHNQNSWVFTSRIPFDEFCSVGNLKWNPTDVDNVYSPFGGANRTYPTQQGGGVWYSCHLIPPFEVKLLLPLSCSFWLKKSNQRHAWRFLAIAPSPLPLTSL